ncbi:hypothetical protein LMG33818_002254 [Halomonadaceae bacterium LMG 33818]|uniref:winged helix-turn-helix transcriptional regulator n=1 Tax=Cernens ardua TaxID=3402176 RepID=UPI003EDB9996
MSEALHTQAITEASTTTGNGTLVENDAVGNVLASACPSRRILKHLTSQWGVLIMLKLASGTYRFSELRRSIEGISERMLGQTLKHLEGDGLVRRVEHQVVPPKVEYSLTPLGKEAAQHVKSLTDWIELHLPLMMERWTTIGE